MQRQNSLTNRAVPQAAQRQNSTNQIVTQVLQPRPSTAGQTAVQGQQTNGGSVQVAVASLPASSSALQPSGGQSENGVPPAAGRPTNGGLAADQAATKSLPGGGGGNGMEPTVLKTRDVSFFIKNKSFSRFTFSNIS
jgi:hypothetical protein